jgi:hypothetical protein
VLEEACEEGVSMKDLTVLATQNDPYRVDTPAGHRDGQWLGDLWPRVRGERPSLHLRGGHYGLLSLGGIVKPNGRPYRNTDEDWTWLQSTAAKAARWLGYIPFEEISDERNSPPVIHRQERPDPRPYLSVGVEIEIPDADDIEPYVGAFEFTGRQPYHLALFCEKSSSEDVLLPTARRYGADLYLPTGEISDTLLHQMARDAADDGRPMKVFTVADCDPAGHQMPISIGRKLQALRDLKFPDLDFEVLPVALTVDQVRELDLPSTPLKETERRADAWREAFDVEQTELDALATLRPEVFRSIVEAAISPYFDRTLELKVARAYQTWRPLAQAVLEEHIDGDHLAGIRETTAAKLAEIEDEIEKLNTALRQAAPQWLTMLLPDIEIPTGEVDESVHRLPLISARWPWVEQTRALIERKSYGRMT